MKDEQQSNQKKKNSNQKEGTYSKDDYWDIVDKQEGNLKKKDKDESGN